MRLKAFCFSSLVLLLSLLTALCLAWPGAVAAEKAPATTSVEQATATTLADPAETQNDEAEAKRRWMIYAGIGFVLVGGIFGVTAFRRSGFAPMGANMVPGPNDSLNNPNIGRFGRKR